MGFSPMTLGTFIRQEFRAAAQEQPDKFMEPPKLSVSLNVLDQVLRPVETLMAEYGVDNHSSHPPAYSKLKYLRQTCLDLQLAKNESDKEVSGQQSDLLQVLHNVMEDVAEQGGDSVRLHYNDLLNLSKLSDILRTNSEICHNEMRRELGDHVASGLHSMLTQTADRIDAAQDRAWQKDNTPPSRLLNSAAANDAEHDQLIAS